MDEDNRSDDKTEEEDSEAGWYFDLPGGAWERQEAKNRELRQSVRRNMDTEEPKKDVFGGTIGGQTPRGADDEAPLFHRSHTDTDEDEDEAIRRRWTFARSGDEPGEEDHTAWGNAGSPAKGPEYSTEPEIPAPAPFKLRSQRLPEEDPAPHLTPPPGLFSEENEREQPTLRGPAAEDAEEPRTFLRGHMPPPQDEQPQPFVPEPRDATGEPPRSRWGDFFGETAAEGTSMLEGMRSWAAGSEQPTTEPAQPDPAAPVDESPAILDIDALPLQRRRHDEDEAPPPAPADAPKSRWDEMFSAKAGDDGGMLEGMRTWAKSSGDDQQPEAPRRRLAPEQEEEGAGSRFEPFEWEASSPAGSTPPFAAQPPEDEKKGGLAGRLFGRKKKDEPAPHVDYMSGSEQAWFDPDDQPSELPPAMSFPPEGEEPPGGSWLGRSDTGENRFDAGVAALEAPRDDAETPSTEFRWQPTIGDDSASDWEPAEPASPAPAPAGADEPWRTQPRGMDEAPAPSAASLSDGDDDMDEWAAEEPAPAFATLGPKPVGEEPWQPVQAIEDQPEPDDEASEPPGSAQPAWQPLSVPQPTGNIDVPSWPGSTEPADAEADEDPWAAFIARRQAGERAGSPFASPEPVAREPQPAADRPSAEEPSSSLWDSAFARVHDPQLEEEEAPAGESEDAPQSSDDPWAAIAEVSGYDVAPGGLAVYRGTGQVEEALDRYEAERDAQDARYADDRDEAERDAQDARYADDRDVEDNDDELLPATYPASHEARYDAEADVPAVSLPEWDDSKIVDYTVLRAFEAHASAYEDDAAKSAESEPVFDELLGDDADEIVAEASQPSTESQYFGRMQGWAPQRTTASGDRPLFPWEIDHEQPSRAPDNRDDEDPVEGWARARQLQPPWTTGDSGVSPAAHAGAPSVRHRSRSRMLVREIVETGLLALLVFLAVRASFQNFKVDGLSMWPTLEDGEYLIVNKLAYAEVDMDRLSNFVPFVEPGDDPNRQVFGGPERGDIVVLRDPAEPDIDLIKRIIGMPGETLEIVDGKVYINDHLLMEPYIKQEWHDTKPKIAIPEGYFFVMGDNRENSKDSRNGSIGLISKDLIIGKAMLTYWPKNKFGLAPNEAGDISAKDGRPEVTARTIDR